MPGSARGTGPPRRAPPRRLWSIPCSYGGDDGPQLAEAASLAGLSEAEAIAALSAARVRVLALGFAPGMPYLGILPAEWDLPRQTGLTPKVPEGALVVAVRQFVLFGTEAPTGWRQVGRTLFGCFEPGARPPDRALARRRGDVSGRLARRVARGGGSRSRTAWRRHLGGARMIEVVACGPLVTVQDDGRPGWLSQGLAQGGAADPLARRRRRRFWARSGRESRRRARRCGCGCDAARRSR